AFLLSSGTITNEGTIQLTDTDGESVELSANDSLVNKAGASIDALFGSGGIRALAGTLRNYGTISSAAEAGLYLQSRTGDTTVNAGSITLTGGGIFFTSFSDTTEVFRNTGTISLGNAEWQALSGKYVLKSGTLSGSGTFQTVGAALDLDFSVFKYPM